MQDPNQPVQLVGDVAVTWLGTDKETNVLMMATHAYSQCVGVDCCELPDIGSVADCAAHALLSSQVFLDVVLACMRMVAA